MSAHPAMAEAAPPTSAGRWWVLAALALTTFLVHVDATVVNVALPVIKREMGFSDAGLTWVVTAYGLAAGGLLLLSGRLADLLGRRRIFLAGVALFAAASLANGLAPNAAVLVVGRFAQGAGEALAAPAALSLVALSFPDAHERAKAFGIWGAAAVFGATAGVVLSGLLTDLAHWRWIFLINIPLAAVPLLIVPRLVPRQPRSRGERIDVRGAVLVVAAPVVLVQALVAASQRSWTDPFVLVPLLAGVAFAAVFVVVESRATAPLVPLGFFANRTRVTANLLEVVTTSTFAAALFLLTLYLQDVLGYAPLTTGLAYVPGLLVTFPTLAVAARLTPRIGPMPVAAAGFALQAAGLHLLSRIPVDGTYWGDVLPAIMVLLAGVGLAGPALQTAVMHGVSEADAGLASGVSTMVQQLGGALGLAVFASLAATGERRHESAGAVERAAAAAGFDLALSTAAVVAAAGAGFALVFIRATRRAR